MLLQICHGAGPGSSVGKAFDSVWGEHTSPLRESVGSRRDGRSIFMSLLAGMVAVGGRPQLGQGTGRARLCAYVKHSTLNSAIEQELRDQRVEGRANATSFA